MGKAQWRVLDDRRAKAKKIVDEHFSKHEVRVLVLTPEVQCFDVRQPGTGTFCFSVACFPYGIAVAGDCGDLLIDRKDIWWLAGLSAHDYLLSKCSLAREDEFVSEIITALVEDLEQEWFQEYDVKVDESDQKVDPYFCDEYFEKYYVHLPEEKREFLQNWRFNSVEDEFEFVRFYDDLSEVDRDAWENRFKDYPHRTLFMGYVALWFAEWLRNNPELVLDKLRTLGDRNEPC